MRVAAADFAQQLEAIAVRQADIEEKQVERLFFEFREARFARLRAGHTVAFRDQEHFEAFADFGLVVNDENRTLRHERSSLWREIPGGKRCLAPAWSERQPYLRAP